MTTAKQLKLDIQEMGRCAAESVKLGGGVYLRIARKHKNADYGDVLWYAHGVELQRRCQPFPSGPTHEVERYEDARRRLPQLCQLETVLTVLAELDRRRNVIFSSHIVVERDPQDPLRLNVTFPEHEFFLPLMAAIEGAAVEDYYSRDKIEFTSVS